MAVPRRSSFIIEAALDRGPDMVQNSFLAVLASANCCVMVHGGSRRCQAEGCIVAGSDPLRDGLRLCGAHRKRLDAIRSAGVSARVRQEQLAKKAWANKRCLLRKMRKYKSLNFWCGAVIACSSGFCCSMFIHCLSPVATDTFQSREGLKLQFPPPGAF